MDSFYEKYHLDATFVAEYITLGTNTTNLNDARKAIEDSEEFQNAIQEEFGACYEDVIDDCHRYFNQQLVLCHRWLTTGSNEINSPFA